MPPSTGSASTQGAKKQSPSTAPVKKPSVPVAGAKPAAPHSSTPAPTQPVTKPSARKTSASTVTNGAASSNGSSNNQSSKRSASSGSASTSSDVKPPTPPKLSKGLKPGEFMPFGTLKLPASFPSLREVVAEAAAKSTKVAPKPTALAARPALQNGKKK